MSSAGKVPTGSSSFAGTYQARGRFWISTNGKTFLGYGRVVLLERIKELGSITKAAASMGMAYRHAWELVDSMNSQSPKPLVVSAVGGRKGGGSKLTPEGERAIKFFWRTHESFKKFLASLREELNYLDNGQE